MDNRRLAEWLGYEVSDGVPKIICHKRGWAVPLETFDFTDPAIILMCLEKLYQSEKYDYTLNYDCLWWFSDDDRDLPNSQTHQTMEDAILATAYQASAAE